MLDADVVEWVQHLISPDSPDSLRQGLEHRVGTWREKSRVIKVYDPREIDDLTFETFFKPAPLLFDYLTDHLLANHFFGDEIRLEGFFEDQSNLQVVISQPFISGRHPVWQHLVNVLEAQGLIHEKPGTNKASFWIDGGPVGQVLVTDVHEDNVIVSSSGIAHPIDVHFSFVSRAARLEALRMVGLWD